MRNFRANVVRNSYVTKYGKDTFIDGSIWEDAKTKSPIVIKELINNSGIKNTSVTAVPNRRQFSQQKMD